MRNFWIWYICLDTGKPHIFTSFFFKCTCKPKESLISSIFFLVRLRKEILRSFLDQSNFLWTIFMSVRWKPTVSFALDADLGATPWYFLVLINNSCSILISYALGKNRSNHGMPTHVFINNGTFFYNISINFIPLRAIEFVN